MLRLAVVALCALAAAADQASYKGHSVLSLQVETREQLAVLSKMVETLPFVDFWTPLRLGTVDVRVPTAGPEREAVLAGIASAKVRSSLAVADVQALIDAAAPKAERQGWFDDYMSLQEYEDFQEELVTNYPELVTRVSMGSSLEGRLINGVSISAPGGDKPIIIISGLLHAREWIGGAVSAWIANELCEQFRTNPDVASILETFAIQIFPVTNPDGYQYSIDSDRLWRKNRARPDTTCPGTDLNRAWPVGWGGDGSSGIACSDAYRGEAPLNEPEVIAFYNYLAANPIAAAIDMHSYSQLLIFPPGYTTQRLPEYELLTDISIEAANAIRSVHGREYTPGQISEVLYIASGGSVDTFGEELGIPLSFVPELRPAGAAGGGFVLPPDQIIPNAEEMFAGTIVIAKRVAQAMAEAE